MIYTAHQPDLLPYSGFWYKMAQADIFDLKIFDQIQGKPGYQRRVKMRDQWVGMPVQSPSSTSLIIECTVEPVVAAGRLIEGIAAAYKNAPNWTNYGPDLCDVLMDNGAVYLWQFNLNLILHVRYLLGITTPIGIGVPHKGRGSEGIVETIKAYPGADMYISGEGGRSYMGDCKEFTDAGIDVVFSKHKAVTGDSILTVLMDYDDPMAYVMAEHEEME